MACTRDFFIVFAGAAAAAAAAAPCRWHNYYLICKQPPGIVGKCMCTVHSLDFQCIGKRLLSQLFRTWNTQFENLNQQTYLLFGVLFPIIIPKLNNAAIIARVYRARCTECLSVSVSANLWHRIKCLSAPYWQHLNSCSNRHKRANRQNSKRSVWVCACKFMRVWSNCINRISVHSDLSIRTYSHQV